MENDLRQKLIQMEAKNLMECMERLESISGLAGFFDDMKNSVVKMVTGGNDVQAWYKVLHENLKNATILIPNPNEIHVTRNNITVIIKQDSSKTWKIAHNGMDYPIADAKDLINKVKSYTEQGTPTSAEAQDVLRYSQAILKCKASPGARHF